MSSFPDPIREGLKRGWKVLGGPHGALPARVECDVAIVGSGAGAGVTAELMAKAGLSVVIVEEGPLRSNSDFKQLESVAYPDLYQESGARKTKDKGITILQGRCVGGSTTVNWTSSFRTPTDTLQYWQQKFGLESYTNEQLGPYFAQAEKRLGIAPWVLAPNENNEALRRGANRINVPSAVIPRNVKNCANLGSCGMGCPTNAKQSMLVTTIPAALNEGAQLWVESRAERFEWSGNQVSALLVQPVTANGTAVAGASRRILARHYVLAAGAINSPAVLMRSKAPDPHGLLGKRTFLHPVVLSAGLMPHKVEGWNGAPQTVYSDHYLSTQALDGPIGYKIEAPPVHPLIFSSTLPGFGQQQAELLSKLPNTHVLLALLRDGFHDESRGGSVGLRKDGSAVLDYPLTPFVMEGARRALLSMAELQFAAGATQVFPVHETAPACNSWAEAQKAIAELPMTPLLAKVVCAHVMGGCGMGGTDKLGVTRPDGQHWQLANLSVHDGSLFPTSIGANPQLSIYGAVNRMAQGLAKRLSGRDVALA